MVVEADRRRWRILLRIPAHGAPVGFGGGEGSQKSQNDSDDAGPHAEPMGLLQIRRQPQKKAGGQKNGQSKLGYPKNQTQCFQPKTS